MTWTGSEPPICYPVHHYVRQWAKVYVTDKTKDEKCYVIDVMQISIVEKSWFAIFFYHYFSSGGKGPQVALLHPRLLAVYSITRSNSKEKTTLESYQMNLVYQHKLTRSAYSMCTGKLEIEMREIIKFCIEIFNLICGFLFHSIIHTTNQLYHHFVTYYFRTFWRSSRQRLYVCPITWWDFESFWEWELQFQPIFTRFSYTRTIGICGKNR